MDKAVLYRVSEVGGCGGVGGLFYNTTCRHTQTHLNAFDGSGGAQH